MEESNLFNIYLEKQRKFIALVRDIQLSVKSREFKNQGYSLKQFSKMKWNISQAQTYRYLICAKVIDQLEEFEIKPAYESLCKSLHNVAKTPVQMKLLWSTILKKTGGRPDCINSIHVNQYWKELCMNKKYSNICNFKDEKDIMSKIEKTLNQYSIEKKRKQLKQIKEKNPIKEMNEIKEINQIENQSKIISYPSPNLSESLDIYNQDSTCNESNNIYSNSNNNYIFSSSPIFDYNNSITNNENSINNSQTIQYISNVTPIQSSQTIYYLPKNELSSNQYEQSLAPIKYIQEIPQSQIVYY